MVRLHPGETPLYIFGNDIATQRPILHYNSVNITPNSKRGVAIFFTILKEQRRRKQGEPEYHIDISLGYTIGPLFALLKTNVPTCNPRAD